MAELILYQGMLNCWELFESSSCRDNHLMQVERQLEPFKIGNGRLRGSDKPGLLEAWD